jgi:hypothetical protein
MGRQLQLLKKSCVKKGFATLPLCHFATLPLCHFATLPLLKKVASKTFDSFILL